VEVESGELRLLGLGSQTVMPPSRHKDAGRRYAWVPGRGPDDVEPALAPAWVVGLMRADGARTEGKPRGRGAGAVADGGRIRESYRNSTLTSLAGSMRRRGMTKEAIRAALLAENAQRCDPPLDPAEVEGIAESVAKYPPGGGGPPGSPDSPYFVEGGRVCRRTYSRGGEETGSYALCNFTAEITEEVILDDGSGETENTFVIRGKTAAGELLPPVRVRAAEFGPLHWPLKHWGARAVVKAALGAKDQLREAIQVLSTDTERQHVYRHTGWRKIGGKWKYLHGGGAIGAKGLIDTVTVELDGKLGGYALPEPAYGRELARAVLASLDLLDLAPDRVTAPGLGAVYRAPLGAVDASLLYDGPTGVGKSEWAALLQQHFGAGMTRLNLPGSWTSTANAIEAQMFLVKDAVFVLDDFKPGGSRGEIDAWHSKADRVFRAQGNASARQRCWADGSVRTDRPPRCFVVATGEDRPRGESCAARRLDVHVRKGDIELPALTPYQENASEGVYAGAMAGYLRWLAGRLKRVKGRFKAEFGRLRARAVSDGHPRTAGILADLGCGWTFFLEFAEGVGAVTRGGRERIWRRVWKGLLAAGAEQGAEIRSQEPARRFLDLLGSAIASGRAHVAGTSGRAPENAAAWGWQTSGGFDRPLGPCVGWVAGEDLYLDPGSAYATAARLGDEQGERLAVAPRQLHKRLDEQGLLASKEKGKLTNRRAIMGKERSVLHLRATDLFPPEKPGEPGDSGDDD
jgi:hypothetical protein